MSIIDMHFSSVLLVISSCLIISSVANDDSQELQECPGGVCVLKEVCPTGMYDETYAQNMITLRIEGKNMCRDNQVCCKNIAKIKPNKECTGGVCIPKEKCPTGMYDETYAQNMITLRIDGNNMCRDNQVCCKNVAKVKPNKECTGGVCVPKEYCPTGIFDETFAQNSHIITMRFGENDVCQDEEVCCTNSTTLPVYATNRKYTSPEKYACGVPNPDGIPNGAEVDHSAFARYGEYPWAVAIFQEDEIYGGGTLIHPWFVLTAAHIFKTADNCVARFGEWDLEQDNSPLPKQFIEIQNVIVHPEYQVKGLWNDVALAHLKREVQYDKHIRPICLPSPTDLFDGQLCTAIGWGMNSSGVQVNVLKRVELPVVPRKRCKQLFAATRLGPFFRLHQSVLCAGGQSGGDMCQGDGGSGLFCPTGSESYVLAGIVSWGLSCHQQDVPGAYVNVAKLVPWINATIEEHV